MPCHAAMIDKFLSVSPDDGVEQTLAAMKKAKTDLAPVVDGAGVTVGSFSLKTLLENLLPVSVNMNDGTSLDVHLGAAPGIAKRLKKISPLKVGDLMNRKFVAVHPDTPLWEGVNVLVQNSGMPILVVEPRSGKALGIITTQSALDELTRLKDSEA